MKLIVLTDNNTYIDKYFIGEPGFSVYLEDGDKKILFDTGYSDVFKKNMEKMGLDLKEINTLCFSHGHNDHTGGLIYLKDLKQDIDVYAHPDVEKEKWYQGLDVGMPYHFDQLGNNFHIHRQKEPLKISEHLTWLGQIERKITPLTYLEKDPLFDDTALMYQDEEGIFIITGCSHSGICNIVDQAKKLSGMNRIKGILGGFHLQNDPVMTKTVCRYFSQEDIETLYPCHCTDLQAKIALSQVCPIQEVGVSLTLEM